MPLSDAIFPLEGEGDASAVWTGIAVRAANSTAGPSRWTHQMGVADSKGGDDTLTRNAIGLSSRVALADRLEIAR